MTSAVITARNKVYSEYEKNKKNIILISKQAIRKDAQKSKSVCFEFEIKKYKGFCHRVNLSVCVLRHVITIIIDTTNGNKIKSKY
jgi:hypothetical protein